MGLSRNRIWNLQVPNSDDFPLDAFLRIGFTHHRVILGRVKELQERLFYIRTCANQCYTVEALKASIARDDYHHQGSLPNNFMKTISSGQQALKAVSVFKDEYLLRVNGGTPQLAGYTGYPNTSIYNLYQSNNKNFQLFVIITAAVYGLNLIDAYVFGHLYDFQVSDDLSLNLSPSLAPVAFAPLTPAPSLQLTFRF